jgi:6-pyruvoyltetrahydropterin/6-carboxytetrahydropterin synthase
MIIGRHFEFEAAHHLPDEEVYGNCRKLHGHTYKLTVEVEGDIQPEGWVVNFKELKDIVHHYIVDFYDHSNLNDWFNIPTVELMVERIAAILQDALVCKPYKLHSVTLYETSNCYAKVICS